MEGAWESGATTHWSPGSPQECPRATDWTASPPIVKGIDLGIIPGKEIK